MDPLPPITPPTPSPMPVASATRWGMLGVVLAGAIVLVIGVYFLSGKIYDSSYAVPSFTPDPSSSIPTVPADWKTYTNTQYGFEFRYPPIWNFSVSDGGGVLDIHASNKAPGDERENCSIFQGLEIQVGQTKDPNKTFKTFVESEVGKYDLGPNGSIASTTISGHPAFQVQNSGWDGGCGGPGYFIEQDARHYTYVFTGKGAPISSNTLDQILSTFRFTSPTSTVPADWKTFTNSRFNYSLKYPADYLTMSNDMGKQPENATWVTISKPQLPSSSALINVKIHESAFSLKQYAEKVWSLNKYDKNPNISGKVVGNLLPVTIADGEAYQFTSTGSYEQDGGGGWLLNGKTLFTFLKKDGIIFEIWFQTDQEQSDQILSTFKFTTPTSLSPSIIVVAPNGGEIWNPRFQEGYSDHTVRWNYAGGLHVDGYLYRTSGKPVHQECDVGQCGYVQKVQFNGPASAGQAVVSLPENIIPANDYRISLSLGGQGDSVLANDESDASFSISFTK